MLFYSILSIFYQYLFNNHFFISLSLFLSEKWLPYKATKRPVIVQKVKPAPPPIPPKNLIIEYDRPKAVAIRQVVEEGVFRVDQATYQCAQSCGEIRFVDRITDLPIDNSRILAQLNLDCCAKVSDCGNNLYLLSNSNSYVNACGGGGGASALHATLSVPSLLDANCYVSNCCNNNNNNNNNNQYYQQQQHQQQQQQQYNGGNYNNNSSNNNNQCISCCSCSSQACCDGSDCCGGCQVQYETITTSVPECLAAKIIAEAECAGALSRLISNGSACCD